MAKSQPVPRLGAVMEEQGVAPQTLADTSGVSVETIYRLLREPLRTCRRSTAFKLEGALGTPITFQERRVSTPATLAREHRQVSVLYPADVPETEARIRYRSNECDVSGGYCTGCYSTLGDMDEVTDLPITRAACMIRHGWGWQDGRMIRPGFVEIDTGWVPEEMADELDESPDEETIEVEI